MKVLIIEDNQNLASLLQRLFCNHQTRVESSLEAGLKAVEEDKPDLVVLDCLLDDTTAPEQSISGIPQMIKCSPDTAVLVYTGYGTDALKAQAIASGAIGLIKKEPILKISELTTQIHGILANSKFPHLIKELEDVLGTKL